METNLLETFVVVADAGGLSAAASMLGLPQSIVSRRIKELETLCKTPLLYRHGRGVKLTRAGETLYHSSRPLIAQIASVINTVAEQDSRPSGVLTIAISPSLMSVTGLALIEEMEQRYPLVQVHLVSGYSRYILEWIIQERVDIGILSDLGMSSQLIVEELGTTRVVLIARNDYELPKDAAPGVLNFDSILPLPLVVPTRGQGMRRHIDLAAAKRGGQLNICYEIDDINITKQLVRTGRVITLISRLAVTDEVSAGTFVEKTIASPNMYARSVLATARNRPITAAMKAAIPVLKSVVAAAFDKFG